MDLEIQLKTLLDLALREDGGRDITSEALFDPELIGEGVLLSKQDGVACGLRFLPTIAHAVDPEMVVEPFLEEGERIKQRMMLLSVTGKLISLLRLERILLNFLARLSGVATLTHRFVAAVKGTGAVILDTRKTTPGWRYLEKYAVSVGGGVNHRFGLDDVALIKDNHIDACGGVEVAITRLREQNVQAPLIVEVRNEQEFQEALRHHTFLTRILLDHWTPSALARAVEMAGGRVLLEASGNITLENVRAYAESGVHFLSIGALTQSASAFDLSFQLAI